MPELNNSDNFVPVGRFAPSPSGRMHAGNLLSAMLSWLSVRSRGGRWILRIEDLDPQRSHLGYARQIEDDLRWLGFDWDEGGFEDAGPHGPYLQSRRHDIYRTYLERLTAAGLTYPCRCTRAEIKAAQAPHADDAPWVYPGTCRPAVMPSDTPAPMPDDANIRLYVADTEVRVDDRLLGANTFRPARDFGDIVLRRADGAWSYQLAVVVDDALMGVNEVVRGSDLLSSAALQTHLCRLLGFTPPAYMHVPLLCNAEGRRLSKRDLSMGVDQLRRHFTPEQLTGRLARIAGLIPADEAISLRELTAEYSPDKIPAQQRILLPG